MCATRLLAPRHLSPHHTYLIRHLLRPGLSPARWDDFPVSRKRGRRTKTAQRLGMLARTLPRLRASALALNSQCLLSCLPGLQPHAWTDHIPVILVYARSSRRWLHSPVSTAGGAGRPHTTTCPLALPMAFFPPPCPPIGACNDGMAGIIVAGRATNGIYAEHLETFRWDIPHIVSFLGLWGTLPGSFLFQFLDPLHTAYHTLPLLSTFSSFSAFSPKVAHTLHCFHSSSCSATDMVSAKQAFSWIFILCQLLTHFLYRTAPRVRTAYTHLLTAYHTTRTHTHPTAVLTWIHLAPHCHSSHAWHIHCTPLPTLPHSCPASHALLVHPTPHMPTPYCPHNKHCPCFNMPLLVLPWLVDYQSTPVFYTSHRVFLSYSALWPLLTPLP